MGLLDDVDAWLPRIGSAIGGGTSSPDALNGPEAEAAGRRALLNFGLNLMASSGYSSQPRSFGQMLAPAFAGAQATIGEAEQNAGAKRAAFLDRQLKMEELGLHRTDRELKIEELRARLAAIRGTSEAGGKIFGAGSGGGSGATGGGVTARILSKDIPAEAVPLMTEIAQLESGGDALRLYGDGGRFTDTSAFPNWAGRTGPGGQPTHAAGKFQFQPGTWKRVTAANPHLTDFGEENQERGAWWLAQEDYRTRTGGRELLTDLKDPARAPAIRQALAPTWPTLGGGSAPRVQVAAAAPRTATDATPAPATPAPATPTTPTPTPTPGTQLRDGEVAPAPAAPPVPEGPSPTVLATRQRFDMLRQQLKASYADRFATAKQSSALDPAPMQAVISDYTRAENELNLKQAEEEAALAKEDRDRAGKLREEQVKHEQALALKKLEIEAGSAGDERKARLEVQKDVLKRAQANADKARDALGAVSQMEALMPQLGGASAVGLFTAAPLTDLFVSLGVGTADQLARMEASQAFTQIIRRVAGNMRPEGSGALSDKEMDQYIRAFPNMAQTPQGRMIALSLLRVAQTRKVDELAFKQRYLDEKGTLTGMDEAMDRSLGPLIPTAPRLTGVAMVDEQKTGDFSEEMRNRPGVPFRFYDPNSRAPRLVWGVYNENGELVTPTNLAPR